MGSTRGVKQELDEWGAIQRLLPPGWEEEAKNKGALVRARGIRSGESLLRILLIHLALGCSLKETAIRARTVGLGRVSSVALFKRLKSSEEWLRWLSERMWSGGGGRLVASEVRVRAVDATVVSEPGSTGTDWRVHYCVDLRNLQCDFFQLTDGKGGETWRRIPVRRGDVLLGDRAYGTPPGVGHVLGKGGEVVVRMNLTNLPLYSAEGERVDPLKKVRGLRVGQVGEWSLSVHSSQGEIFKGRLIALKRSGASTQATQKKILRETRRKGKEPSQRTLSAARFFFLWTSLPAERWSAEQALELYRIRWQIELAFKRMKSIMGLGHLPKKDPRSARAWLHGKIFVSLLVERLMDEAEAFSPWGYPLGQPT